jgi:hypothetical protein
MSNKSAVITESEKGESERRSEESLCGGMTCYRGPPDVSHECLIRCMERHALKEAGASVAGFKASVAGVLAALQHAAALSCSPRTHFSSTRR